jgi:hypothetical protein
MPNIPAVQISVIPSKNNPKTVSPYKILPVAKSKLYTPITPKRKPNVLKWKLWNFEVLPKIEL